MLDLERHGLKGRYFIDVPCCWDYGKSFGSFSVRIFLAVTLGQGRKAELVVFRQVALFAISGES